jgi:hypothetical protein
MDLAAELQKIYDSEINIEIGWFWDSGITVRLGDTMDGYLAEENVNTVADIVPWLQKAIAHFHPDSEYAQSLDADVKALAETTLFQPPQTGAQVRCPHCGAPHANPGGFDELIAFTCLRCGTPSLSNRRRSSETPKAT